MMWVVVGRRTRRKSLDKNVKKEEMGRTRRGSGELEDWF
jgi:hypothetical protein